MSVWARELLATLRTQLSAAQLELRQLTEENERLRNLAEGRMTTEESESNTFLVSADLDQELPLGVNSEIRFGLPTVFSVCAVGNNQLAIVADRDMKIIPEAPYKIIIIAEA